MRVPTARKKLLWQRDQREILAGRFAGRIQTGRIQRSNFRPANRLLKTDGCRTSQTRTGVHLTLAAKGVVGGILGQQAGKIRFRAQDSSSDETVQREVVSFRALQRVITLVANEGKSRSPDSSGQRQYGNSPGGSSAKLLALTRRKSKRYVIDEGPGRVPGSVPHSRSAAAGRSSLPVVAR